MSEIPTTMMPRVQQYSVLGAFHTACSIFCVIETQQHSPVRVGVTCSNSINTTGDHS